MKRALVMVIALASTGCISHLGQVQQPATRQWLSKDLIVHCDADLPSDDQLLHELENLRSDVTADLKLPTSDVPIHVFLFGSSDTYREFMNRNYPGLPNRRAFFVESNSQLAVYAQWDDQIREDLRHELTHGYLHAAIARLPLWLDEGIAEYYEVPPAQEGLNRLHVSHLLQQYDKGQWKPDLARLEELQSVQDMSQRDYAEAWAWVHWMMVSSDRRKLLTDEVGQSEPAAATDSFVATLHADRPDAASELIVHLKALRL